MWSLNGSAKSYRSLDGIYKFASVRCEHALRKSDDVCP
jgi:hypothetical protein